MFCAILYARGRVVSDDWQLPDQFESESLTRNALFLAVDRLLASPPSKHNSLLRHQQPVI